MPQQLKHLVLTRIPVELADKAKKIGRDYGFRRSQVINRAIELGLPLAAKNLSPSQK